MGSSQLKATIKKIEIINKAMKEEWHQSIRVVLGDIELNNDNLIQLRQFRPDEAINVSFDSIQLDFEDLQKDVKQSSRSADEAGQTEIIGDPEPSLPRFTDKQIELLEVIEGDRPLEKGEQVKNEFRF